MLQLGGEPNSLVENVTYRCEAWQIGFKPARSNVEVMLVSSATTPVFADAFGDIDQNNRWRIQCRGRVKQDDGRLDVVLVEKPFGQHARIADGTDRS